MGYYNMEKRDNREMVQIVLKKLEKAQLEIEKIFVDATYQDMYNAKLSALSKVLDLILYYIRDLAAVKSIF